MWYHSERTRGNSFKPEERRSVRDVREKCLIQRTLRSWNRLSGEVMGAPSLGAFEAWMEPWQPDLVFGL